ncbi:Ig-like domain (group 3) [Curtobacterium sp. 314Chir4.1]|uniref:Ig-like domain repeat protein n=1 Tax=Curtobacterium sp. 314Chir4.1 TaxID=1279028 RepID=UPI000BCF446D|nr:Ig-like domain repeat protein [Curtobacterium sp. 314Chir4.1]SOC89805.1 Ig-like domain (group 3) [Curtobacterium sp. 314Chir4.1]
MRTQPQKRAVARARSILAGFVVAGLAGLAVLGAGATTASAAAPAQTTFVQEGFTGASAGTGYILPTTTASGGNVACLTARPSSGTNTGSIPTCSGTTDADGSGALRLTSNVNNQSGGVGAKQSVPITKGIDAVFNSYQYNGTSADGIVFYLAATDPYNPTVPAKIGYLGGSLGYSASTANNAQGLSHAYLGIGLDRFGNFANRQFGGTGCDADAGTNGTLYANAVTVRGPGDGSTGYCVQSKTLVTGSLNKTNVTDRAQAKVPVEIVINPTSSMLTAQENTSVSVPAGQYAVIFTSIGGTQQVVTGALPKLGTSSNAANIDSSWIDPATGYPYKLTYGWVAGTGGQNDVHEVNYLKTTTAAGPVPVLTAQPGGTSSVAHAGSGTYTVTPTVSADGGSESQLVRTTTTFPAGFTPAAAAATGDGWTCSASGQVVTCDQAAADRTPGTVLPQLTIPYTVSGAARTATVSTVVASTDAEAITITRAVTVEPQPSTVTVSEASATVGDRATLSATVASGAAQGGTTPIGTVTFTDTTTGATLCSATIASGVASCTVATSEVGTKGITATYSGDSDHTAASGTGSLVVSEIPTEIALTSDPESAAYGETVTLGVDGLEGQDGTLAAPTGTVEFREGDTVLCTATLPDTSCDVTGLSAGKHSVTAVYSGDSRYAASTAVAVDLAVRKASTTLTPAPSDPSDPTDPSGPSDPSDPSDTTVTVTHGETTTLDTPKVPKDATGTIDYVADDGTVLCTATLPDTTCAVPSDLAGGKYRVHAKYSGDDNYEPAEGEPFDLVVTAQPTELVASTDTAHTVVGKKVRLSASGLPAGATGTVTFTAADGTVLCTATLPETDCETDALPVGTNTVTVAYSGDASFAASSTSLEVVVDAAPVVDPGTDPTDDPTTPADPSSSATPSHAPSATGDTPSAGELAFTGSPLAMGTGIGLAAALLLAGLVLLMVCRTRAARESAESAE